MLDPATIEAELYSALMRKVKHVPCEEGHDPFAVCMFIPDSCDDRNAHYLYITPAIEAFVNQIPKADDNKFADVAVTMTVGGQPAEGSDDTGSGKTWLLQVSRSRITADLRQIITADLRPIRLANAN